MKTALNIVYFTLSLSIPVYAGSTIEPVSNTLQSQCIDSWMAKAQPGNNDVDYKNFGEKYCGCMSNHPQSTGAQNARLCLSQTVLHDAMDSLEEEVGIAEAASDDLGEYCQDRWTMVYLKPSDVNKKVIDSYCECVKPKLLELLKQADKLTDKQYDETIDTIAVGCVDKLSM